MRMTADNTFSKKHFKTIIISDVHLGIAGSKPQELSRFLRYNTCETLLLNGDIIDGWELKKYGSWKVKHTRFFKVVMKMMEEHHTKVVYLHGNHDDFLDNILPLTIGNLSIQLDYIHESLGKRYYVVHGDIFDSVTTNLKWIAKLGSLGYNVLLWVNKLYNSIRKMMGKRPYSFSQYIKTRVKSAVSPTSKFEKQLTELAKFKGCQGIICGHTHRPAIKMLGEVMYMNSGDWIDSLTALTEDFEGNWELVYYKDWLGEKHIDLDEEQFKEENAEIDKMEEFYRLNVLNGKIG
jgi:UDP-2,3-diacylglucosamine pyrophosphatase LpxH